MVSLPIVERPELLLSSLEAEREVTLVSEEGLLLPTSSLLLALHSPSLASLLASLPPTPSSISVPAPALPLRFLLKLLARGVVEGGGVLLGQVRESALCLGITLPRLGLEEQEGRGRDVVEQGTRGEVQEQAVKVEKKRAREALNEQELDVKPLKKRGRPPKKLDNTSDMTLSPKDGQIEETRKVKSFSCKVCRAVFKDETDLNIHLKNHLKTDNIDSLVQRHATQVKLLDKFVNKKEPKKHLESISKSDSKILDKVAAEKQIDSFTCNFCQMIFSSRGLLNYHMSTEQCL